MLGKLMKYEWRGLRKPFLILLAVLAGTTLLSCLLVLSYHPDLNSTAAGFWILLVFVSLMLYYVGLIVASLGMSLFIMIRFYKTCYTEQGYLTHTLPVSPKLLVLAKTLSACLMQLIMTACIILSVVVLITVYIVHFASFMEDSSNLSSAFHSVIVLYRDQYGIDLIGCLLLLFAFIIIGIISNVCTMLGCVSLGQLYTKHRVIGIILAYFGTNTLLSIFSYLSMIPTYAKIYAADYAGTTVQMTEIMGPTLIITLITLIVLAIIMYFINIHMMTKRLNLE